MIKCEEKTNYMATLEIWKVMHKIEEERENKRKRKGHWHQTRGQ